MLFQLYPKVHRFLVCVHASFEAQTHNIVGCYPSQLADRASEEECFQRQAREYILNTATA